MAKYASYTGEMVVDSAAWYCPYIPSIYDIVVPPKKITQTGLSFSFNVWSFLCAFEWVLNECMWRKQIEWNDDYQYHIKVTFNDAAGAVEFKLRFMA